MSVGPELALAASARDWPDRLHRFLLDHGGGRVLARVMGPEQAIHDQYDVLLIDDVCSFLTPRLVHRLREAGREIVGVYSPSDGPDAKRRLLECGITDVIEADAEPEEFVAMSAAVLTHRVVVTRETRSGSMAFRIGVTGSGAGTGVTEVAIALASQLGSRGSALLIDLNQKWPALAQRLDLALHPNLRTAVDLAHHSASRLNEAFHRCGSLAVVTGLANPGAGQEVPGHELSGLMDDLAMRGHEFLIADLGPLADLSGLDEYNLLIVVGTASPVGLTRLVQSIENVPTGFRPPILVVVNRAPAGGHPRSEIRSELSRSIPGLPVVLLPGDPRIEAAAWNGLIADRGGFHRAVKDMAALLIDANRS